MSTKLSSIEPISREKWLEMKKRPIEAYLANNITNESRNLRNLEEWRRKYVRGVQCGVDHVELGEAVAV